jgi:hypothetical protein
VRAFKCPHASASPHLPSHKRKGEHHNGTGWRLRALRGDALWEAAMAILPTPLPDAHGRPARPLSAGVRDRACLHKALSPQLQPSATGGPWHYRHGAPRGIREREGGQAQP